MSPLSCGHHHLNLLNVTLQTNDPEFDKLWAEIDPNETGYVSFEAFLDFMTKQMVDQDTADQVLESFKVLAGDKVCVWSHCGYTYVINIYLSFLSQTHSLTLQPMSCVGNFQQSKLTTALLVWHHMEEREHLRELWTTCPSLLLFMGRASSDSA